MTAHTGNGSASASPTFGDRLTEAVAQRESQIVLGHRPRPGEAVARRGRGHERGAGAARADALRGRGRRRRRRRVRERAERRGRRRAARDRRGGARPLPRADRRRRRRRASPSSPSSPASSASARPAGSRSSTSARTPASAACSCSPTASAATSPSPRRPTRRRWCPARRRRSAPSTACGADAFTANPLLGRDALEPLIEAARAHAAGAFVLVRTSNPGAADLLDLELATGERLWERLATLVAELGAHRPSGLSRRRRRHRRDRAPAPRAPARADAATRRSCCPGIGAQGGDVAALAPAFAPGRAGGLVTASRSIANAHEASRQLAARSRPRRGRAPA